MSQILRSLLKHGTIEDIDISKTGINNDKNCLALIGDIIKSNKSLRSLNLQRLSLTEVAAYSLVEPLSQSLNVETLHFDYNNLGSTFV